VVYGCREAENCGVAVAWRMNGREFCAG
jgi:hypothetical protein